ncbi:MAG: hypothetical protein KDK37_13040 [Leptospiraceae bacterium]|nr:hypothetical protein [Leptospiraceae bacterium]
MELRNRTVQVLVILSMIAFAVAGRLLPHPDNFAPVAALGLMAGYLFASRSLGLGIVMIAMAASDLIMGFESLEMRLAVYGGLMVSVFAGRMLTNRSDKQFVIGLPLTSVAASVAFFVISNLAVWAFSGMYDATAAGLGLCYVNAIPFFWNTLAGDLVYSGMLLGAVRLAQNYYQRAQLQSAS